MNALLCLLVFSAGDSLSERAAAAVKYANESGGNACLVMHEGKTIAEAYANVGRVDRAQELASGTKSFSGVVALCAVEDGILDLDARASDTLLEWKTDPRKSRITVRQLLTLTSGLPGGTFGQVPSYKEAVQVDAVAEPGTQFAYGPVPFQAFGELMRRKLSARGETVMGYLERRILKPCGITPGFWRKDRDGQPHLPSGAGLTARDWAKFGEMIRLGGKGVLPEKRLAEAMRGTSVRPGYGLTWWLPGQGPIGTRPIMQRRAPAGLPKDLYMAVGAGGQYLIVIPSEGLTIVRQAPVRLGEIPTFNEMRFLRILFGLS